MPLNAVKTFQNAPKLMFAFKQNTIEIILFKMTKDEKNRPSYE